ncbi:MAG: hypothetical protein ABJD43_06530, partial [Marinomonas sp.]
RACFCHQHCGFSRTGKPGSSIESKVLKAGKGGILKGGNWSWLAWFNSRRRLINEIMKGRSAQSSVQHSVFMKTARASSF